MPKKGGQTKLSDLSISHIGGAIAVVGAFRNFWGKEKKSGGGLQDETTRSS